jgi:proteasome lid subunit RPN8/RPN11
MFITLKDLFPMQKGVSTYTEYMYDEILIDYRMDNPATNYMKVGHMHSHNTMGTFFSGTDTSELHDNSEFHNYYLSVIVNNYFDVCARVAFRAVKPMKTFSCKNEDGEDYKLSVPSTEEVMFYYDCEIVRDQPNFQVDEAFVNRTKHIIAEAAKPKPAKNLPAVAGFGGQHNTNHMKVGSEDTKVVELPGTKRTYLSDYLPKGFNPEVVKENPNQVPFEFVNDDYLAEHAGENIVYDADQEEEDMLDEQADMMEDLLIEVMLSYPRIQREYQAHGDQLTLLDDVFAFIRPRVGKNTRDEYIRYVLEKIPEKYAEQFTMEAAEFDNDYLVMIQLVGDLKEDYVNAQFLYPEMISFLQKFRDAGQQTNPV